MTRWFALVFKRVRMGYALDYYPDERASAIRSEGGAIIGDYATQEAAQAAIREELERIPCSKGRDKPPKPAT